MKTIVTTTLMSAALLTLAACSNDRELNQANIGKAMQAYLAQRGDLCLAKNSWPIDVTAAESGPGSRNGVQMPVLEKLGLVSASDAVGERRDDDGNVTRVPVRRYQLTDEGKKYYLARAPHKHEVESRYAAAPQDFCAGKLSLDRVVKWETPKKPGATAPDEAIVTYTYHIAPAPWAKDPDVSRVFPMLATVIKGEGAMELKEAFVLTDAGWEAKDI
jgi:hypothetical protein